MSAKTARRAIGTPPATPPPRLRPGERYRLLKKRPMEDANEASVRARTMPWWSTVVIERPTYSGGHWIFVARA